MAKRRKVVVGSVVKGREGKPDYIKVSNDVHLKQGQFLNLETKAAQLKSLEEAVLANKLSPEIGEKIKAQIEKTPDFVRFQVTLMVDEA